MSEPRFAQIRGPGTIAVGAALFSLTAFSWLVVVRNSSRMVMPHATPSITEAIAFIMQWGVMMAAMMLPSAAPMILLYRPVSARLRNEGEKAVSVAVFAATYLFVWLLVGLPVYAAYVIAARAPFSAAVPYVTAGALIAAGLYQFSNVKRVCLHYCEAPLSFLMRRWRSGYAATLRIAFDHALYCVGCCWALMLILVVAGAMSLPWVLTIAVLVFAEKILPHGARTAQVIGAALIVLGIAVALRPELAATFTGERMVM